MTIVKYLKAVATIALALASASASAAAVLARTSNTPSYALGGAKWTEFTGIFTSQHTLSRTADISNLTQLQSYDAVWVDQNLWSELASSEISALTNYISSGHKAVLIGENYSWDSWNNSLMSVVGGDYTGACSWGVGAPSVSHSLTAGISSVTNVCGSMISSSTGSPTVLFSNNMAALYTVGSGEALVILDCNWNDDDYSTLGNKMFEKNIVDWLGTTNPAHVPEPSTYALILVGIAAGSFVRRSRS